MKKSHDVMIRGALMGMGWIFPPLFVGLIVNLFVATRFIENEVFRVVTFACNPTSPFCTPAEKILTMLWIVAIGIFGAYLFAKERTERVAFVISFSALFWFFHLVAVFVVMIVALFISMLAR